MRIRISRLIPLHDACTHRVKTLSENHNSEWNGAISSYQRPRYQFVSRRTVNTTSAASRYGTTGASSSKINRMPAATMTITTSTRMTGFVANPQRYSSKRSSTTSFKACHISASSRSMY